jgi:hypothetical protein
MEESSTPGRRAIDQTDLEQGLPLVCAPHGLDCSSAIKLQVEWGSSSEQPCGSHEH